MTTATSSALSHLLLVNLRVLDHVFDDALYCACILKSLSTKSHLQSYHITLLLQLFSLDPDPIDFGNVCPVPNDFGPQGAIPHASESVTHMLRHGEIRFQHAHRLVSECFDSFRPIVRRRLQLASVVRAVGGDAGYDVRVIGHVDLDEPGWGWTTELVGDGEGYRLVPLVDLKILQDEDRRWLSTLLSAGGIVARWSRSPVARLSSDSCLTSSTSSSYHHPLGRVGRRYCVGIFIVLLDGRGQLSDQRDSVFTREAKSCQVGIEQGRLSTRSDRSSRRLV